jgi:hypothetical protein
MKGRDSDFWSGYEDKRRWVTYWSLLGCWISVRYGPFSLGVRFETYEPFISLIFQLLFRAAVNRGYWISGYRGTTVLRSCVSPRILLFYNTCTERTQLRYQNYSYWFLSAERNLEKYLCRLFGYPDVIELTFKHLRKAEFMTVCLRLSVCEFP